MYNQKELDINQRFSKHWVSLSLIIILTLFAYSNSLRGELLFDDKDYILTDTLIQSPYNFKYLNLWEAFKGGVRPVSAFTFSLNYYLFGRETFSYHVTNLLIHITNGILVYLFIYITLARPSESPCRRGERSFPFSKERLIAFLTSLLFSLHPIQTESVSYIYQRSESLSSLFYLVSLISFIFAARELDVIGLNILRHRFNSAILYVLSVVGFVLALGSKEIAVTLPATAFLYGIFFFEKKGLWKKVAIPFLLLLAGIIVAAARLTSLRESSSAGYYLKEFTAWEYLLTQFSVIVNYLRLLLFPVGQNVDHGYAVARSILEGRTMASIVLLSAILAAALFLYKRWRAGTFFTLWFFLLLLPSSSVLPLKDLLVEHRLYLPSLGVFFLMASGMVGLFEVLTERFQERLFIPISISLIIATAMWYETYDRNRLWCTEIAMWEDAVKKSPLNMRAHTNLAVAYGAKALYDDAIREYQHSLRLDPFNPDTHKRIGLAYSYKGTFDKALDHFKFAIRFKPEDSELQNSIGIAYSNLGMLGDALEHYKEALKLKPDDSDAHNEIGIVYEKQGRYDEAIQELQSAIKIKPGDVTYHYNLGNVYYGRKRFDDAIRHYQIAIRINPEEPDVHNNLGFIFYEQGRLSEAEKEFRTALRIKPAHSDASANLKLVHDKLDGQRTMRSDSDSHSVR